MQREGAWVRARAREAARRRRPCMAAAAAVGGTWGVVDGSGGERVRRDGVCLERKSKRGSAECEISEGAFGRARPWSAGTCKSETEA